MIELLSLNNDTQIFDEANVQEVMRSIAIEDQNSDGIISALPTILYYLHNFLRKKI